MTNKGKIIQIASPKLTPFPPVLGLAEFVLVQLERVLRAAPNGQHLVEHALPLIRNEVRVAI